MIIALPQISVNRRVPCAPTIPPLIDFYIGPTGVYDYVSDLHERGPMTILLSDSTTTRRQPVSRTLSRRGGDACLADIVLMMDSVITARLAGR